MDMLCLESMYRLPDERIKPYFKTSVQPEPTAMYFDHLKLYALCHVSYSAVRRL